MNLHKVLVISVLVLLATKVFSQPGNNLPQINVSVGYLYTKLTQPEFYDNYIIYDFKTEAGNGYAIALLVDFPLKNFGISLGSSYSVSNIFLILESTPSVDQGLWRSKSQVKMSYIDFSILLKYYPCSWLNLQSGFRFSFPRNHQIKTLEIEELKPDIPVPPNYPLGVWSQYKNLDILDINIPMGITLGPERGPFVAFNYYLGIADVARRIKELYGQILWMDQRRNSFEVSVGWKFGFKDN